MNPSDLARAATGVAIETFGIVADALATEPDLKPLGFATDMSTTHKAAVDAARALNRETDEDSAAMKSLREARVNFDRAAHGHARLMEGILVHEGKEAQLGQYVLAKDPMYAARRAAQVPISEEPGAGDIESEPTAPAKS